MKSSLDCLPCFVAQGLKAARLTTSDEKVHEQVLREVLLRANQANLAQPPVRFGRWVYELVGELTGEADPHLAIKQESNRLALELLPAWRERLRTTGNPRQAAVRLAIAANVIDFAVKGDLTPEQIPTALERSFAASLHGDVEAFFRVTDQSASILFLADNAGELVFDRLLLEMLPRDRTTLVVKGGPAINDALLADAQVAGIDELVPVVDTGCAGAGIVLEACSPEFRRRFERADLIIAKGQANFESLEGSHHNIFFLFKAKCSVVAQHIGRELGSLVLHRNVPAAADRGAALPPTGRGKRNPPRKTTKNERIKL